MHLLNQQMWRDGITAYFERLFQSGIESIVLGVVVGVLVGIFTWLMIRLIRSRQLSIQMQAALIGMLKRLNQPIHEKEALVLQVANTIQTLFRLQPTYHSAPVREFFDLREVQQLLYTEHPLITSQGMIRYDRVGDNADDFHALHQTYIEAIEQIYAEYCKGLVASVRKSMPPRAEFARWWGVALCHEVDQQLTAYEKQIQQKLDDIAERLRRMESFETRVSAYFRVVNKREYTPASAHVVQDFYRGRAMLSWEIVAAGAVLPRNQRVEFIERFGSSLPAQFELVCVTGEMGEGKTTFLWDAALEIVRRLDCFLVQCMVLDPAAWGVLASAVSEEQRPVVVLVDDVFTSESFKQAMYAVGQVNLPIRVLASSRPYDLPKYDRFPYDQVPLQSPTRLEIDGLLDKFGQSHNAHEQRVRLYGIKSWLVLMMELSSGSAFENVVLQSLEYLRNQDVNHYLAYIHVCFVFQYNIAVPRDLLSMVRPEFRNIQIPGYLFDIESTSAGSLVRAVHTQIAMVVVEHVKITHELIDVMRVLCSVADYRKHSHRYMIGMLGAEMVRRHTFDQYQSLFELSQPHIQQWFAQCTHVEVFNQITTILYALKLESELTVLHRRMLSQEPQTVSDWRSLLMYAERTKQRVAFNIIDALKRFAQSEQQDAGVWNLVIQYLVAHQSNQFAAQQLIPLIAEMISRGKLVRAQYLELVERFGTNKQCDVAVTLAIKWIEHSKGASQIAIAYTRLVSARGTVQMKQQAVRVLAKYVPLDDSFAQVLPELFQCYLALLKEMKRTHDIEQISQKVNDLLQRPEWNVHIARKYMLLVDLVGTSDDKNKAITQMTMAIEHHCEDVTYPMMRTIWKIIDGVYLNDAAIHTGALRSSPILKSFLQTVPKWLVLNPNPYSQSLYLRVINKSNNPILSTQALEYFQQWLVETPIEQIDIYVFTGYCQLLSHNHTTETQYELVLRIAEYMFGEYEEDAYIRANVAQMLLKQIALIVRPNINPTAIRLALRIVQWTNEHTVDVRLRKALLMLGLQCTTERELCIGILQSTLQWYQKNTEVSFDANLLHMFVTLSVHLQDKATTQAMLPILIHADTLYQNRQLFEMVYELVQKQGTPAHRHTIGEKLYVRLCDDPTDEDMLVYVLQLARSSKLVPFISKVLHDQFNWLLIHTSSSVQQAYQQLVEENVQIANPEHVSRVVAFWKRRGVLKSGLEASLKKVLPLIR